MLPTPLETVEGFQCSVTVSPETDADNPVTELGDIAADAWMGTDSDDALVAP